MTDQQPPPVADVLIVKCPNHPEAAAVMGHETCATCLLATPPVIEKLTYTTCPRCQTPAAFEQFCRLCSNHFGPGTAFPAKSDQRLRWERLRDVQPGEVK